ncbi:MAG: hypothetical protein AB4057_18965, partial [Crocosphaera sp.]
AFLFIPSMGKSKLPLIRVSVSKERDNFIVVNLRKNDECLTKKKEKSNITSLYSKSVLKKGSQKLAIS